MAKRAFGTRLAKSTTPCPIINETPPISMIQINRPVPCRPVSNAAWKARGSRRNPPFTRPSTELMEASKELVSIGYILNPRFLRELVENDPCLFQILFLALVHLDMKGWRLIIFWQVIRRNCGRISVSQSAIVRGKDLDASFVTPVSNALMQF